MVDFPLQIDKDQNVADQTKHAKEDPLAQ